MKQTDFENSVKQGKVKQAKAPSPEQAPQPNVNLGDITRQLETYLPYLEQLRLGKIGTIVYSGNVVSNAAGTKFPTGWSVAHSGTGTYSITHNLGTSAYAVALTTGSSNTLMRVTSHGSNSFGVFATNGGSAADTDFDFLLSK